MNDADDSLNWCRLIPLAVHPCKVLIIETMLWIDRPLSASELEQIFGQTMGVSAISYLQSAQRLAGFRLPTTPTRKPSQG
jgi:hypothetical protein